ncbi:MAG: VWA domain-containing protein [Planctomycetota bacterium]|nr:VWA domain-containing protein [Planctomycetota bacterium]
MNKHRKSSRRRGAVVILFMVVLPALLILSAVAINLAYLQLSRTELMVANDLAANAAGRTLSAKQSVAAARDMAISIASSNQVAGRALALDGSSGAKQIEFGVSAQTTNSQYSKFQFDVVSSLSPKQLNAVRVNGKQENISVYFPGLLPNNSTFKTQFSSVSMQVDRDIALVFDRSGSMREFEMTWPSGVNPRSTAAYDAATTAGILRKSGSYYYYTSGQDGSTLDYFLWNNHFKLQPVALTKWQKLTSATDSLMGLLSETPNTELVSVTTYSSSAKNDLGLSVDYSVIMSNLKLQDVNGNTAIGSGMTEGVKNFATSKARPFSSKTMVVLTDGYENSGSIGAVAAAKQITTGNVTIHTITFGKNANTSLMKQVAQIGNGRFYDVDGGDAATLTAVFQDIVNNLPTILVQ